MKLIVDDKVCSKYKMTLPEVLLVLVARENETLPSIFSNMVKRGMLRKEGEDYYVNAQWNDIVDKVLYDSSGGMDNEERLLELAKKVREVFPKGKQYPGSPYYFRCNNREVMLQLKRFFNVYGNFPDDEVVDAARRYVASFNGNYEKMRLVKYFIMKDVVNPATNHIDRISELASFLENKEDNMSYNNDDSWTGSLRN